MHTIHAHGADIPALGLGTWELTGETCSTIVREALAAGYRHIDTAAAYGNEAEVGRGIRDGGVPREELFVTTKIWHDSLDAEGVVNSVEESIERLDTGYVDLLLIHWPSSTVPLEETLAAMMQVRESGCTRHIGVSNFPSDMLERAVALTDGQIVANQIEYHPYLDQTRPLEAARAHGLVTTAYCPIARGRVLSDPVVEAIAQAHGKKPVQVALRWLVQQDRVAAIPRTSRPERLAENLDIFDFELERDEMDAIFALARPDGRMVNVSWAPEWD